LALITVVKSTDFRDLHHRAEFRRGESFALQAYLSPTTNAPWSTDSIESRIAECAGEKIR
jgi:hypothetical protein